MPLQMLVHQRLLDSSTRRFLAIPRDSSIPPSSGLTSRNVLSPQRTMSSTAPKLRSLYRSFLRELPPHPILKKRSPLHNSLREHFHNETSQLANEHGLAQAEQCLAYVRAQRTYVTLLERYNPGVGMDEAERVRLSARRIGMELPAEYGKKE